MREIRYLFSNQHMKLFDLKPCLNSNHDCLAEVSISELLKIV